MAESDPGPDADGVAAIPTGSVPTVPAPVAPDDPDAWYAPAVLDQREIHPGVVATVAATADERSAAGTPAGDRTGDSRGDAVEPDGTGPAVSGPAARSAPAGTAREPGTTDATSAGAISEAGDPGGPGERESTEGSHGDAPYRYELREPPLSAADRAARERVREHFADTRPARPRTRAGVRERAADGLAGKYERIVDGLVDRPPAARRRLDYHLLCDLRLLGAVTPLALDGQVEVADAAGERLRVHTERYAPAVTDVDADAPYVGRVLAEQIERYSVAFRQFDVPVVIYRERVLGGDSFEEQYAVLEPDLLPGDRALVEAAKERIWETSVPGIIADPEVEGDGLADDVGDVGDGGGDAAGDRSGGPADGTAATTGADPIRRDEPVRDRASYVAERARTHLSRRLTARNTRAWRDALSHRVRATLADYGFGVEPVDDRFDRDRLEDLVYYVLRDFVGEDRLTIPIRDDRLEDVEANRVGERVKVVPRPSVGTGRIPTNLTFERETRLTNLVTQLAARDGVELNASNPSAKVNVEPRETEDVTIRCAVGLGVISEDGPHVSIRKQSTESMTPVDLIERDAISPELVALLWLCYEHHGVVVFAGPTGVGKTTLLNAHMPFVRFDDRPISIDEGSREVRLPHETGVSLTTRDHENEYKRVTMADLMTETNYLNPDVEVIAEINTPESFATFGEVLNTGHGVLGTTHAESVDSLVNRAIEQGLPAYLLREIDLVVLPKHVGGERYVGEVLELVDAGAAADLDGPGGSASKDGTTVHWNRVAHRDHDGAFHLAYDHPDLGDDREHCGHRLFARIADDTDRPEAAVAAEYRRKCRYVEYMCREGLSDAGELAAFLADLQTDEAATVERIGRA